AQRPVDGVTAVANTAVMFALAGAHDEALRLAGIHRTLAERTGAPEMIFFTNQLCARVQFLAHNYEGALRCSENGRQSAAAPPEYLTRLLIYRVHALARLGRGAEAREAMQELRRLAGERGDPGLTERLDLIEPEVLNAEGDPQAAFDALVRAHEASETLLMTRFNDGVREMR